MILCQEFKSLAEDGKNQMADVMKTLVYGEMPSIFEHIDFNNDIPFFEPLLFAYFNRGAIEYSLESLFYGYSNLISPKTVFKSSSPSRIEYFPNMGYYYTDKSYISFSRTADEPCLHLSNGIEILRHQHVFLENRFTNIENYKVAVEISKTVPKHLMHLEEAFDIIEKYLPELHDEILKTNRKIVLFHNTDVLCFVTIEVHGTAFVTTNPENGVIFFLEEIIHQCSHNLFNTVLFNRKDYFKIDIENANLGNFIGNQHEQRSIFSALHGLFTVAKRYEAFFILYKMNIFEGSQKHEFLGRFADIKKRFRTGLECLNHKEIFTSKGIWIYDMLDNFCYDTILKVKELDCLFDLSNQPSEFSYEKFCRLNPIM